MGAARHAGIQPGNRSVQRNKRDAKHVPRRSDRNRSRRSISIHTDHLRSSSRQCAPREEALRDREASNATSPHLEQDSGDEGIDRITDEAMRASCRKEDHTPFGEDSEVIEHW